MKIILLYAIQEQGIIHKIIYRYLKLGSAIDNFPKYTIPAMVGRPMLRYD